MICRPNKLKASENYWLGYVGGVFPGPWADGGRIKYFGWEETVSLNGGDIFVRLLSVTFARSAFFLIFGARYFEVFDIIQFVVV